ncbi:glycosyltransferase family 39 protein [Devosia sp.]|uniref:glycosyltransferase family 39 protein n=1 Tax=Devosia sp. TaxID=1871048 RepID=UPI003A945564
MVTVEQIGRQAGMADESMEAAQQRRRMNFLALVVAVLALVARGVMAVSIGLDGDEAYYAMWAAWPSPGYLDHPPGVALFIAAGEALAGVNFLGVRLMSLVGSVLTVLALYRTTRLLVPFPAAPGLAVILFSLTLVAATGFVATPDAPSMLFWMLSVWAATEAVVRGRPNWWLAVGLFAGAGLVGKYTNAWLGVGLVLYLLATPVGRRQLLTWQLWAGGALAILVFSPVLWWNYENEWRSFLFQGVRIVTFKDVFGKHLFEFLAGQFLVVGPALLVISAAGAIWWALGRAGRYGAMLALPVLTSAPALVYFLAHGLHSRVEANWPQPLLAPMTLVAAALMAAPAAGLLARLWRRAAVAVHVVLGAGLITLVYIQGIFHPFELGVLDRTRMLRGWGEMAAEVRAYADSAGAKAIWIDGSYRLTGEMFFHGQSAGDPRPVRSLGERKRYDYIPAAQRYPGGTPAIVVDQVGGLEDPRPPDGYFAQSRLLGVLPRGGQKEYYAVWAVSEPTSRVPKPVD